MIHDDALVVMGSPKTNTKDKEDELKFLEDLSDGDHDELEGCDSFCLSDECDGDATEQEDVEPLDDKEKTMWRGVNVWEHYRPWLITEIANVVYLCSPHPVIIAHSQDSTNKDPKNLLQLRDSLIG